MKNGNYVMYFDHSQIMIREHNLLHTIYIFAAEFIISSGLFVQQLFKAAFIQSVAIIFHPDLP